MPVQRPLGVGLACLFSGGILAAMVQPGPPPWQAFIAAGSEDGPQAEVALAAIARHWQDGYAGMVIDVARFLPSPTRRTPAESEILPGVADDITSGRGGEVEQRSHTTRPLPRGATARRRLTSFLERQTGRRHGDDLRSWRRWLWSIPAAPHPDYAAFKGELYARVDPAFRRFFPPDLTSRIRLDEIDWGGVGVNGIPPLRSPQTVGAQEATWLRDSHTVFGVVVNNEARAYPKRILAWHEMALDRLGGIDLTIVYCTLCGTVIPYDSRVGGRLLTFGTSGLLYRSNKLMFDEETGSLWSSLEGIPVTGPLASGDLRLRPYPIVTTTWGEWRRAHPATTVLSLDTGHRRDYSEGAAYRDYFSDDRLMFEVQNRDTRLKNKAEVVVLRRDVLGNDARPVAIPVDGLRRRPVFQFAAGTRPLVVITTPGGANLVYEAGAYTFDQRLDGGKVRDRSGRAWTPTADALESDTGERLPRLSSHRAFWFGWVAQHPDTILQEPGKPPVKTVKFP